VIIELLRKQLTATLHDSGHDSERNCLLKVALARKLLIGLWRYLEHGVFPEGARLIFLGHALRAPS
jgi:hypothetical protein